MKDGFISRLKWSLKHDWQLYVLALPALIYLFIFKLMPIYGLQIAFKDYSPARGFLNSKWIGFDHFERFFNSLQFWPVLRNTMVIGFYELFAGALPPVILALLLHNMTNKKFKSFFQTISYAPHFISTVVVCGMVILLFSPTSGAINAIIAALGGEKYNFMADPALFPHIYVWSGVWQKLGWSSILYLSALAGADQELYEAAKVDGANKLQRIIYLDVATVIPLFTIQFIMSCGSIMSASTQKVLMLQNSLNLPTSEIINTYVYKQGLTLMKYGYSSAIGLFQTIVDVTMLLVVNKISGTISENSLW